MLLSQQKKQQHACEEIFKQSDARKMLFSMMCLLWKNKVTQEKCCYHTYMPVNEILYVMFGM